MISAREKLLIGVTNDTLLQKKAYADYLEPYAIRKESVISFCNKLNPAVLIEIFSLIDPVGPAGTDSFIEACILTREVEKGGKMINDARTKNGLPSIELVFVDMILAEELKEDQNKFSNKTSSTYIREYLAQRAAKRE